MCPISIATNLAHEVTEDSLAIDADAYEIVR
jgi:hypothetical protein